MAGEDTNRLEQLRAALAASSSDYVLLSPVPDGKARLRFIGPFQGRDVVWETTLYTLARHRQERGKVPTAPNFSLRGLMIIEPDGPDACRLEVALDVPVIDETVVRKTIVMMRNYRALRLGLRTWGDEDAV